MPGDLEGHGQKQGYGYQGNVKTRGTEAMARSKGEAPRILRRYDAEKHENQRARETQEVFSSKFMRSQVGRGYKPGGGN